MATTQHKVSWYFCYQTTWFRYAQFPTRRKICSILVVGSFYMFNACRHMKRSGEKEMKLKASTHEWIMFFSQFRWEMFQHRLKLKYPLPCTSTHRANVCSWRRFCCYYLFCFNSMMMGEVINDSIGRMQFNENWWVEIERRNFHLVCIWTRKCHHQTPFDKTELAHNGNFHSLNHLSSLSFFLSLCLTFSLTHWHRNGVFVWSERTSIFQAILNQAIQCNFKRAFK